MKITLKPTAHQQEDNLVLGTSGLGGVWGKVDLAESVQAVLFALQEGVKVIDTAPSYADAQMVVGEALKQWDKSKLPIICTKTGRLRGEDAHDAHYDYSPSSMEQSVQDSLKILGVEVIDVLFLHDPASIPVEQIDDTVATMLKLKQKGYAKAIGLGGNFENPKFYEYLNQDCFTIFQGFNRLNLLTTIAMEEEFAYCKTHQLTIHAASPLFMGLLGSQLAMYQKNVPEWMGQAAIDKALVSQKMAEEMGVSLPELAFRFLFSCAQVDRVVTGADSMDQVRNLIEIWKKGALEEAHFQQVLAFAEQNY